MEEEEEAMGGGGVGGWMGGGSVCQGESWKGLWCFITSVVTQAGEKDTLYVKFICSGL